MNIALVCAGMPVLPILTYFVLTMYNVTSVYKVIIPEIIVVVYTVAIAVLLIKKVEAEEREKRKTH
ncbi:uncharacterized protein NEMAJ01_0294 [Nematocida major]|uniref:uncharacterized protein n=1 Tax=Nematocida major TaxID=1912982 RepID=UPI002007A03F|nr:uncharacterized protein NEMAJ01_0294 [Nematocida major]KAH9385398.1 hypothetical protein NEMAJ01_0294 [Nematocida major]